jgi:hypothetical protein
MDENGTFSTRSWDINLLGILIVFNLTFQLPLIYKHLFSSKLRKRSGVLLYGPPGTGKVGVKGFLLP